MKSSLLGEIMIRHHDKRIDRTAKEWKEKRHRRSPTTKKHLSRRRAPSSDSSTSSSGRSPPTSVNFKLINRRVHYLKKRSTELHRSNLSFAASTF